MCSRLSLRYTAQPVTGGRLSRKDLPLMKTLVSSSLQHQRSSQWCQEHFLNYKGLLRAVTVREQLRRLMNKFKVPRTSSEGSKRLVFRSTLVNLIPQNQPEGISFNLEQTPTWNKGKSDDGLFRSGHSYHGVTPGLRGPEASSNSPFNDST